MQEEFLFAGFGGQGVMFVGQLLAYAAMDEGLEVTWIPSYGPEMRGGTAHCTVVVSDKPIGSPVVSHPQIVIAFNNPSFQKYEPVVASNGLLAYNVSLISFTSQRHDIDLLPIPASDIADKLGNLKLLNMVLLGAVLAAHPVISLEAIQRALEAHLPAHRRDLLPLNFAALERGAQHFQSVSSPP
jgi:2-oxoglutarate ferredoxin oxidoreductase subunit gamma